MMAARTAAQEEFDTLVSKQNALSLGDRIHPEDRTDREGAKSEDDEDTTFRKAEIENTMRMPTFDRGGGAKISGGLKLPDRSFDNGTRTGVKGVIADARSYEEARRRGKLGEGRIGAGGNGMVNGGSASERISKSERARKGMSFIASDSEDEEEDEEFLERWRESRRLEIQNEVGNGGRDIRNRRTSPSVRRYGRFDEVDALGYLDAIEKVGRETKVVVFVYDSECPVSQIIDQAITPLVRENPTIHFVRVHYDEIEFDNAGVPAVLAYKNQGELFANLTYVVDQIPEDTLFDTDAMRGVFKKWAIL